MNDAKNGRVYVDKCVERKHKRSSRRGRTGRKVCLIRRTVEGDCAAVVVGYDVSGKWESGTARAAAERLLKGGVKE